MGRLRIYLNREEELHGHLRERKGDHCSVVRGTEIYCDVDTSSVCSRGYKGRTMSSALF